MFYLGKVVDYLLLPPGVFVVLLLIGAIYAWRFRAILLIGAVSLYLISIKPISNALLAPLESFDINETSSPKAVVFLGGGTNPNGVFKAYPDAFKREVYALIIAKNKNLPLLFSGGGINEREGIDTKKDINYLSKSFNYTPEVYYENHSLNTWENAKYSAEFFEKKGWNKDIILVTSAYHMKRASLMFKNFGFRVDSKSVGYFVDNNGTIFDYLPQMPYLSRSYKALHEYLGLVFFAFKQIF
jgi:uncharacterized SAM-binding protein YcdF (DUF218 family)